MAISKLPFGRTGHESTRVVFGGAALSGVSQDVADRTLDVLLRHGVSEDGALHAEKYYRTVTEEFAVTRPAFRWRHLVGLARVTASEYGRPAPGYAEARQLLKLS